MQPRRPRIQDLRLQGQAGGANNNPFHGRGEVHVRVFTRAPRCGEVYNLGGGKDNSCFPSSKRLKWRESLANRQKTNSHLCGPGPAAANQHLLLQRPFQMRAHYPKWKTDPQSAADIQGNPPVALASADGKINTRMQVHIYRRGRNSSGKAIKIAHF